MSNAAAHQLCVLKYTAWSLTLSRSSFKARLLARELRKGTTRICPAEVFATTSRVPGSAAGADGRTIVEIPTRIDHYRCCPRSERRATAVITTPGIPRRETLHALPDSLAFATLDDLGRRWRAGEFTAVELAGFFLQRLDTLGRELGAVATLCHDLALRQARQADDERRAGRDRGPLHGMPVGVKDLLAVRVTPPPGGANLIANACWRGKPPSCDGCAKRGPCWLPSWP